MKALHSVPITYEKGSLKVLDQRALPHEERWIEVHHPNEMVRIIQQLSVRGAPLIGVAAAMAVAAFALKNPSKSEILEAIQNLRAARPTAVNLMAAMDRLLVGTLQPEVIVRTTEALFLEEIESSAKIAAYGASVIQEGEAILTHCNTGALVTPGVGTALGAIFEAVNQGKQVHVYVDETRPLLQGARLTTWELERQGIPYTLLCDNMAASLMASGKVNRVFVGADRIAANGDFANKIGTLGVAVLAQHFHVPFHCLAPMTTVDFDCASGEDICIENRDPCEVLGAAVRQNTPVYNPAFDVTPYTYLESLILDRGIFSREALKNHELAFLQNEEAPCA